MAVRRRKAVVLHSGGLDSTVCLLLALKKGRDVVSLGIDYDQSHRIELQYAAEQCRRFAVSRRVLRVAWDKPDRNIPMGRHVGTIGQAVSPAFLPARNGLFLMLSYAEAAGLAANEIWIGVNSVNFSGYPDCTPAFIEAFRKLAEIGMPNGPRLVAPLQNKSKPQIGKLAKRLGLVMGDTWSCYRPSIVGNGIEPCGSCDACVLHQHAWGVHPQPTKRQSPPRDRA